MLAAFERFPRNTYLLFFGIIFLQDVEQKSVSKSIHTKVGTFTSGDIVFGNFSSDDIGYAKTVVFFKEKGASEFLMIAKHLRPTHNAQYELDDDSFQIDVSHIRGSAFFAEAGSVFTIFEPSWMRVKRLLQG